MPMHHGPLKDHVTRRHASLIRDRQSHETDWRDIKDYILPEHGILDHSEHSQHAGKPQSHDKIFDGTATRAMNVLGAGLMGGLTSPSRPWFRLTTPSPQLNERADVRAWLYRVEERMRAMFARTNLYKALHHTYIELAGFGTGAIGVQRDTRTGLRFRPFTAGEYYIAQGPNDEVNAMYRDLWLSVGQMVDEFGLENCSEPVRNLYREGQLDELRRVVHAVEVYRHDLWDIPYLEGKGFVSAYYEYGTGRGRGRAKDGEFLRVRGFDRFPALAPRWFTVGAQAYGVGQGKQVLADTRTLQAESEIKLVALDKEARPPVVAPGARGEVEVNTMPDGITYDTSQPAGTGQGARPLYQVRPNLQAIMADIQDLRYQIRQGLFNDLFLLLASQNDHQMTAREVAERHEEKMMMLGPVLERLHDELLTPLIDQAFDLMGELGVLPEPPEDLSGQELKVEYISILAQAQRMVGLSALEQFAGFVGNIATVRPEVLDKIDPDELVEVYGDRVGVPPDVLVSDEDVMQVREQRAQQAAQQARLEQAQQGAEVGRTLADIDVTGGNAVAAMLGRAGGATPEVQP